MFINKPAFYFATIRKITASFGTLFNNIKIQRFEQPGGKGQSLRTIEVPLEYASSRKWWTKRVRDVPAQKGVQTRTSFPRIAFQMTGIQYNSDKQLGRKTTCPRASTTTGNILTQLNPVPYDISYDVYIAIKNIDDGLQIIEQILPFFRPSYNLTINDIPELGIKKNLPIMLAGVQMQDEYEGVFDEAHVHIWTLSFAVKAHIYPPIDDSEDNLIKTVMAQVYNDKGFTNQNGTISVDVDPIDAMIDDDWTCKVNFFDHDQLDSNGQPIRDSNGDPI